ncbi:MAG TPA: ABC transporter permease, partial [Chloroflexota bacterium]|nr:ABC transporter permease [Chloroflexota bacterium]
PVAAILGNHYNARTAAALRHALGLDQPIWDQYFLFVGNALHGNLGQSVYYQQPVIQVIGDRLAPTAWLVVYSAVLAALISLPLAIVSALRANGVIDQLIRALFAVAFGMPAFWVGIVLILILSIDIRLFPVSGFGNTFTDHIRYLFLPALTIGLAISSVLIRSLRNSILEVIHEDYIRTARAKGIRGWAIILRHVLRNALLPTVTIFGVNIAFLLGSTVIIENVFAIGGIGQLLVSAILQRDYPVVQGITLVLAVAVVAINLLTDVFYALLDPRVTYG